MIKYLFILFLFISSLSFGQTKPAGFPTLFNTGWQRWGFSQSDSGSIIAKRDTLGWLPRFTGTTVVRPQDRDVYFYDSVILAWKKSWNNRDTLSSYILTLGDSTDFVATTKWVKQQLYGPITTINNTNTGTAFRWLNAGTQEIKTVSSSNTILWDSTSNANALTAKADTSILATQYDLTQVSRSLQQTMDIGNVTNRQYIFDSISTASDGSPSTGYVFKINPLDRTGNPPPFIFALGATKYVGVTRRDNVAHWGWNMNAGGGPLIAGEPFVGHSAEHTYISTVGDTIAVEMHTFLGDYLGRQIRGESYTGRKNTNGTLNIDHYHAVARSYLKHPYTDRVYFNTQPSATGALSNWTLSEAKGFSIIYDSITGVIATLTGAVSAGVRTFDFENFDAVSMPTMAVGNEIIVSDGATLRSTNTNTTQLGDASRRWSTIWGVNGNFSGTLTATTGRFGGGGVSFILASLSVSKHNNDGTIVSIENNNTGTGAYTQLIFDENISGNKFAEIVRYGTNATGNITGTSIPFAQSISINSYGASSTPNKPVVLGGDAVFAIPGVIGTNKGFRQDATGLRVDAINALHTTNVVSFSVNATDAMKVPSGTDAQRPTGVAGYTRYNTTSNIFEWYNGTTWVQPATGSTLYSGDGTANNRTVTVSGNDLIYTSALTGVDATMTINNTSSGYGLYVNASGVGTGIDAGSSTGYGGNIHSVSGPGLQVSTGGNTALIIHVNPSSTNSVHQGMSLSRSSTGTPAAGEGVSIDLENETSLQLRPTTQLISKLTDVTDATRTSQFEIWGVNSGTLAKKLSIAGSGQLTIDGYGDGTFTGTATRMLGSDVDGNLLDMAAGNLLEISGSDFQFNDAYMTSIPNTQIFLKSRMQRLSFAASDANFTTLATRQEGFFVLPEITANRTFTMFSGTSVDGVEFYIKNSNTSGTFSWSFTGVTPEKASDGTGVTTLVNGVLYHILGWHDGTNAHWIIVNQ